MELPGRRVIQDASRDAVVSVCPVSRVINLFRRELRQPLSSIVVDLKLDKVIHQSSLPTGLMADVAINIRSSCALMENTNVSTTI